VLNTNAARYGGTGAGNLGQIIAEPVPSHDQPASARVHLPPLSVVFLVAETWQEKGETGENAIDARPLQ